MNVDPTPEQLAKLPKWASQLMADHQRRCRDAEGKLKDYLDSQSESLIYTRSGLREKSYIQDDRVSFKLKNGEITIALKADALECHASYGLGRLVVVPQVTNVVHLEIEGER